MKKLPAFIRQRKKTLLICLIPALLLIWYFCPVTLLSDAEAEQTAYIYIRDGRNGNEVYLSDPDAMEYIINCFNDQKFHRLDPALGMGMSCFWEFYDANGKLLCDIRMRTTDNFKEGGWFHTPVGDAVNYDALFAYSAKLANWGTYGGDMPQPPQEEDFATPDIPIGAALAKYSFDTDHITYWTKFNAENAADGYLKLEITDAEQLEVIADSIDLQNNLQPIPVAEQFTDYAPNHFLDFHNGTVLAYMEGFDNYLWIIETSTFGDSEEDFQIHDGMIGPYHRYWAFGEAIDNLGSRAQSLRNSRNPAVTFVQWEQ